MKFSVSSKLLYSALSGVSKVINSKNTLTVLDNFLFELDAENNLLTVTASDTENTLIGRVAVTDADTSGHFLANAKRMCDIAKELPDLAVNFNIDMTTYAMKCEYPGGQFDIVAMDANQYPVSSNPLAEITPEESASAVELNLPCSEVLTAIDYTLFAVATDQIRPQLLGIYWDIKDENITFVATDTRKLVVYENSQTKPGLTHSIILPFKPAVILKSLLKKDDEVKVLITEKSATFTTQAITLSCRLIKGNYAPYERVIPKGNPFVATFDRETLLAAVRRVSVCADPTHGLTKFRFTDGKVEIKVDDTTHATFATEQVACDYTGRELVIGFSCAYVIEILSTISTANVLMKLADPARPAVFVPEEDSKDSKLQIILMPMTVQEF